jgi:hypothetical protein
VCISIISPNYGNVSFVSGLSGTSSRLTAVRGLQRAAFQQRGAYREMDAGLEELSRKLEQLGRASERYRLVSGSGETTAAAAVGSALSLSTTGTLSTLTGSAEINTTATSFSPRGAEWDGGKGSTAQITVGGTYTGSTDETYTFEVNRDRTIGGSGRVRLDVYDGSGTWVEQVVWDRYAPEGTVETTSFGLEVSFGGGDVTRDDTFHVTVSASTGTDAVTDNPLGGTRETHPELEDAYSITDGQFLLNGEVITVSTADTLDDVLDRISASAAGVTATISGDVVTLTADSPGDSIDLTGDTSGLIAALKLDTGVLVESVSDERLAAMSTVDDFAGVTAGSFEVNGVTIAVDPADSITDILDRINASGAGVTASLTTDQEVRIVGSGGGSVVLSGDTSGLLSAVGIAEDTYSGEETRTSRRGSRLAARKLSEAIAALAEPLNRLFPAASDDDPIRLNRISMQSRLKAAIRGAFEESDLDAERNDIGLAFDLDAEDGRSFMDLSVSDLRDLQAAMRDSPREMSRFLFGSQRREGLLSMLTDAVDAAREEVREWTGGVGVALSTYA